MELGRTDKIHTRRLGLLNYMNPSHIIHVDMPHTPEGHARSEDMRILEKRGLVERMRGIGLFLPTYKGLAVRSKLNQEARQ